MKKEICLAAAAGLTVLLSACVSSESQVRDALEKNPKLVFDVIEKNPEQFMESVTRAARLAQQKQQEKQIENRQQQQEADLKNPKSPEITPERVLFGKKEDPITIVEYADFQCPACGMAHNSLTEFKEKHKGEIRFVFKNMPLDFHRMAYSSALYFEAIRLQDQKKALKFHDTLFENQQKLSEDYLKKTASEVGADMTRLAKDIKSRAVSKVVREDMAEFQKFGFTGTPVIIVNGVALEGAQPLEELERVASLTKK
jgi:protein-disulfide isomerase